MLRLIGCSRFSRHWFEWQRLANGDGVPQSDDGPFNDQDLLTGGKEGGVLSTERRPVLIPQAAMNERFVASRAASAEWHLLY